MTLGRVAKRAIDYGVAAAGLVAGTPLMLVIAAAIRIESPGSPLFVQERLGRGGKPFRLIKFRTMKPAPVRYNLDGSTKVEPGDDRVTRVGRYLRGALDELPQLINVLRGEMSLVGPRPDMVSQRALYSPEEERKLAVLPGITGLAVVLGRTELSWRQRIAVDIRYVERWGLLLDLKILVQTIALPLHLQPFRFDDVLGDTA